MKIPFLDLKRQSDELGSEIDCSFKRVMERGNFILGDETAAFEREWSHFCKARGAVGVANGTDALTLALTASGAIEEGRGDEVITTPLSAAYTSLAIVNAGAKAIFADIDEDSFNLSPEKIEKAVTPRTRAIVPVHLFGQMAEMEEIGKIAARHNLIVIEDAAQAHGAGLNGKPVGHSSLAATFSFYPTKNLGAYGDGGAVVSNDEKFLESVRLLRQGGHVQALDEAAAGRNSRLDEMQAAFLRVKLKKLDAWTNRRRALAQIYFERLSDLPGLRLPAVKSFDEHVFHLFVIRHECRDELREFLARRGIETLIHYPFLLHRQRLFQTTEQAKLPSAEKIFGEILSLPLYPQLGETEIETICEAIIEFETRPASVFTSHANRR